jgi:hypothetical protein
MKVIELSSVDGSIFDEDYVLKLQQVVMDAALMKTWIISLPPSMNHIVRLQVKLSQSLLRRGKRPIECVDLEDKTASNSNKISSDHEPTTSNTQRHPSLKKKKKMLLQSLVLLIRGRQMTLHAL